MTDPENNASSRATRDRSIFDARMSEAGYDGRNNSLVDILYDGFYLLFMLRNGNLPESGEEFADSVRQYLDEFERRARKLNKASDDIYDAKYAFCAAIDETILNNAPSLRDFWELRPLQLQLFGDQLAGEHFFDRLEDLRSQGASRLEALEVFYLCLLLGFRGKFALEGTEKLGYITSRVGDEIASMKGRHAGFAPHWQPPDSITHALKREVPLWVVGSVCTLVAVLAVSGLGYSLSETTHSAMNQYHDVVQMPPKAAHLTITLP